MKYVPKWRLWEIDLNRRKKFRKKISRCCLKRSRLVNESRFSIHKGHDRHKRIVVPSDFSLSNNYEGVVKLLLEIRNALQNYTNKKPFNIDLSKVSNIQPAAALALAAELDRGRRKHNISLQATYASSWKPHVFCLLDDLGLFKILEIKDSRLARLRIKYRKKLSDNEFGTLLKFVSSSTNNKSETDKLAIEIRKKVPLFSELLEKSEGLEIVASLAEASLNSIDHAYDFISGENTNSSEKRWWAVAAYKNDLTEIRFLLYDLGVGIARTMLKTKRGKIVLEWMAKNGYIMGGESKVIEAVLKAPRSSTLKEERGKGLKQITDAITGVNGFLKIVSGKGEVEVDNQGIRSKRDKAISLGGTLIEWRVPME